MTFIRFSQRRSGMALFVVLALLAVLSGVLVSITFTTVSQRQSVQERHHRLQAEWLARSGLEIAAARILEKPVPFTEEYSDQAADGKVRIVVEETGKAEFTVTSDAEVGRERDTAVLRSMTRHFRRTEASGGVRLEVVTARGKD
jgi:hypothetical protein